MASSLELTMGQTTQRILQIRNKNGTGKALKEGANTPSMGEKKKGSRKKLKPGSSKHEQ